MPQEQKLGIEEKVRIVRQCLGKNYGELALRKH